MSRNVVTDLRWQAGELMDDVQRLVQRAEQVSTLALEVKKNLYTLEQVEAAMRDTVNAMSHPLHASAMWATLDPDQLDVFIKGVVARLGGGKV